MRNEGITILQIVITVIIMFIIISIAIIYGQGIAREARIGAIYTEIKEVESALKEASLLNELSETGEVINVFNEVTMKKVNPADYTEVLGGATLGNFYYLDFTTSRALEKALELENIENDYILDFSNLNIYLVEGIILSDAEAGSGVVDVIKYNSDEIANYYNDTFVK